jgi:tetratricopeptide (TPR) repeat protein
MGDFDNALVFYERALAIDLRTRGEDLDTATTYNNLANAYTSRGNLDQAVNYAKKGLAIRRQLLGPNHVAVATSLNTLGSAYRAQAHYELAIQHIEQSLEILEQFENGEVAIVLNNLAYAYRAFGNYEKAIECSERALDINQKTEGMPHLSQSHGDVCCVACSLLACIFSCTEHDFFSLFFDYCYCRGSCNAHTFKYCNVISFR